MSDNSIIVLGASLADTCLWSGVGALAAVAIGSPVGAAGGAVYGAVGHLVSTPIHVLSSAFFGAEKKNATVAVQIASLVVSIFASMAATKVLCSAMGLPLTFGAVCALSATTTAIGVGIFAAIMPLVFGGCILASKLGDSNPQHRTSFA